MKRLGPSEQFPAWIAHLRLEPEPLSISLKKHTLHRYKSKIRRDGVAEFHLNPPGDARWRHQHAQRAQCVVDGGRHHASLHRPEWIELRLQDRKARPQPPRLGIIVQELTPPLGGVASTDIS